ncbi:ATP-dependent helicase HrpB [Haloferula chungangensis]|uniref:ATP-dependent helicase HrpB n=1 Tax=Haloferula chungangensis TaxID=1048331 RepID=A0ABW2L1S8_9BACT
MENIRLGGWFLPSLDEAVRLPVHEIEEDLRAAVASEGARVLLKAPTGSGKSTAVPGMLRDAGLEGRILVIEPRRMAARMLAGWVARQRGGTVGAEVGYAVRFDSRYGRETKVIYLTDGLFQRWLQDDPELSGVSAVVFDEFHERRLAVDVALGRCLDLQESARPDLRVVVMSATLETGGLAKFLEPAVLLEAGGRTFPVEISYRASKPVRDRSGRMAEAPVWEQVAAACREALTDPDCGDVLCFLPGTHEIRRTVELLENAGWARERQVFPLYSGLPPAAQEAAVGPCRRGKIIVSTNVAETSLTIDGVRTVIDAGLARVSGFDPRRGISTLLVQKISRAAADQRAGRAGRTAAGRCIRLWSESEHARREGFEVPEVRRVDLSEVVLLLLACGVEDVAEFRWLETPSKEGLERALGLLHDLGATDAEGNITEEGKAMAALPLEPRFARLMMAGVEQGCVSEMAFVCAAVQGEGIWASRKGGGGEFVRKDDFTDFQAEWRGFDAAAGMNFDPRRVSQFGVRGRGSRELAQGFERLLNLASKRGWPTEAVDFSARREAVGHAMLAGFSDRLGVKVGEATLACRLVGKRKGKLDDQSAAKRSAAFVAAEITEVEGREVVTYLKRATAVELAWLREIFPEDFKEVDGAAWDESRRRVVARRELRFRDLVLESKDSDQGVNLDAAAEELARRVLGGELVLKKWDAAVEQWCARLACLSEWMPEMEMPCWGDDDKAAAVAQICHGATSYKEIKDAAVWPVLKEWLSVPQRAVLDSYAPERLDLVNGRSAKVTYEYGKDPWIGLRVRDLFGVWETPTIAGGKVPVLVHVQAPNQRAWQMTKDLESFWRSGYSQMRKDLAGRYPKHPWPEDPRGEK